MADKQSFLSKQGLEFYHSRLVKDKLQPASEVKRGLIKITDFPCYTSNMEQKFSEVQFTTGTHAASGSYADSFSFLGEDINGVKITPPSDPNDLVDYSGVVTPLYTVVLDGKVYEHLKVSISFNNYLYFKIKGPIFEIEYRYNSSLRFSVNYEPTDTPHDLSIYKEGVETVHKLDKKYAPAIGLRDIEGALDITTVENHLGGMTMAADGSVTESHSDYTGATFTKSIESTGSYTMEAFEWNLGIGLHDLESKTIKVVLDNVTYQANPIMIQDDGNVVYYLLGALSSEELAEETDQEFLRKYEERGFADFPFKMHLCIIIRTDSQTQVQTPVFAIWEGFLSESAHTLELSMVEESEKIKSEYLSVEVIPDSEINALFV